MCELGFAYFRYITFKHVQDADDRDGTAGKDVKWVWNKSFVAAAEKKGIFFFLF